MDIETEKSELISWINRLKDQRILQQFLGLKRALEKRSSDTIPSVRTFGSGTHIFTFVADDFNEPLQDFDDHISK